MTPSSRVGLLLLVSALLSSCEGIDCTLNNVVLCHYYFYSSETGNTISLADTLTVTAEGTDSVLYNKGVSASYVSLPMSYHQASDTLTFTITGDEYEVASRIIISKTNTEHYESPDCPTAMFHTLTAVAFESDVIDSIVVSRADVNYLQDENVKIYFRTDD